ncbi:hypothetical protein V6N11_061976 [Hibiscus sabdariffa]|uniref:Cyclin C-terminal domain-containing protein n=1 Tax=Hibiscus sabdariffa TaxID=183260 RepID=A0ABR2PRL2_9ROSI
MRFGVQMITPSSDMGSKAKGLNFVYDAAGNMAEHDHKRHRHQEVKQKNARADGRNRRVLQDIGNFVDERAPQGKTENLAFYLAELGLMQYPTAVMYCPSMNCAKLLVKFHSTAAETKLKALYRKFSSPDRNAVALLAPARSLLPTPIHHGE